MEIALLVIFVIAWLVSPIVLIIICASQKGEIKRLRAENEKLRENISYSQPVHTDVPSAGNAPSDSVPSGKHEGSVSYAQMYGNDVPAYTHEMSAESVPAPVQPAEQPAEQPVIHEEKKPAESIADSKAYTSVPESIYSGSIPSYAQVPPKQEKKNGTSTINIILVLGAMFITLAGFVFAAAAWGIMGTFFKSAVLLSFSALFFGLHSFAEKKLGLEHTGKVFFTLGSVFLPAAAAAAGILGVFGEYLSFSGEGKLLMAAIMTACGAGAFLAGAVRYDSRHFARAAYAAVTCTVSFIIVHISPDGNIASLLLSLYALAVLLAEPYAMKKIKGAMGEQLRFFTIGNTWVLSVVTLFMSEENGFFVLPAVIFSAAFFINSLRSKNPASGAAAFSVYLMTGMMVGIRPDDISGFVLAAALVMIVYTVLCMMDVVPEEMRKAVSVIHRICSGVIIAAAVIAVIAESDSFEPRYLISAAAVFIQLAVLAFRGEKGTRTLAYLSFVWFAFEIAVMLIDKEICEDSGALVMAALCFAYYLAVTLTPLSKKLSSVTVDISAVAVLFLLLLPESENTAYGFIIWAMLTAAAFISGRSGFGKIAVPAAVFFIMIPAYRCSDADVPLADAMLITSAVYCAFAAAAMFIKKAETFAKPLSFGIPVLFGISVLQMAEVADSAYSAERISIAVPFILSAYTALSMWKNMESRYYKAYGAAFLLCITSAAACLGIVTGVFIENAVLFTAVMLMLMFGVWIFPAVSGTKIGDILGTYLSAALPAWALFSMIAYEDTVEYLGASPVMTVVVLLTVCSAAAGLIRNNGLFSFIELLFVYPFIFTFLNDNVASYEESLSPVMIMMGITAAVAVAGHLIFRSYSIDGIKPQESDFLSLSSLGGAAYLIMKAGQFADRAYGDTETVHGSYMMWLSFVLLCAVVCNMIRKDNKQSVNRAFLTAGLLMLFPIWTAQSFFTLPEIITTEWNIVPVVLICFALRFIYPDKLSAVDGVSFAAAVISLLVLFFDAMGTELAADAVMLGVSILLILVVSFLLRQKRWFALSIAAASAEALILTLKLWNSRTWWIYLLAAGIILIALGMANEMKKRNAASSEKTARFMSDWKW